MERRTAGHKRLDKRTRDEYVCDQWRCLNHLLKVVEHEQQFLVGKVSAQLIRKGPSCFPSHAQRLGDGGQDKSMIVDGLQPDKNETVGKACLYRSGDLLRKSGLPNARRTCEGEQTGLWVRQQFGDGRFLTFTPDERRQWAANASG